MPTTAFPTYARTTTTASQPKTAVFQWLALHAPIRPATFIARCICLVQPSSGVCSDPCGSGPSWITRLFISAPSVGSTRSTLAAGSRRRKPGGPSAEGRVSGVLRAEERQHREHAARLAAGRRQAELREDA